MKKYISVALIISMLLSLSNWGITISNKDSNKKTLKNEISNEPIKEFNETTMFVPKSSLLGVVSDKMDNTDTKKTSLNVLRINANKDAENNINKTTQYTSNVQGNLDVESSTPSSTIQPTVQPTVKPSPKPTNRPTVKKNNIIFK